MTTEERSETPRTEQPEWLVRFILDGGEVDQQRREELRRYILGLRACARQLERVLAYEKKKAEGWEKEARRLLMLADKMEVEAEAQPAPVPERRHQEERKEAMTTEKHSEGATPRTDALSNELKDILAGRRELTEAQRAKALEEAESIVTEVEQERPHTLRGSLRGTNLWLLAQGLLDFRDAYSGVVGVKNAVIKNLQRELAGAKAEIEGLRSFKRSVDEAMNSGDGSYRP